MNPGPTGARPPSGRPRAAPDPRDLDARSLRHSVEGSPERLIAAGRLFLAVFGLVAIWLDPSQPAAHAAVAYALLLGFVAYSAGLMLLSLRQAAPRFRIQLLVHVVDVSVFSVLLALTEGQTSPFFIFFTFALFAALLRWNWIGVAVTAAVLVLVFVAIGAQPALGDSEDPELSRRIIRSAYLFVAAGFLMHLGVIRERAQVRLEHLAHWPPDAVPETVHPPIEEAVRHAASLLGAKRAIVLWEEADEPYLYRAVWTGAQMAFDRLPPLADRPAVDETLADVPFALIDADKRLFRTLSFGPLRSGPTIDPSLIAEHGIRRAIVAPMRAQDVSGHLVLLEPAPGSGDQLLLGEIAAARLGGTIQRHLLRRELSEGAAERERARLFRDLHDSIVQTLTAVSLQIRQLSRRVPGPAGEELERIGRLVSQQQAELRTYIGRVRQVAQAGAPLVHVGTAMDRTLQQCERMWRCSTELQVQPPELSIPDSLGTEMLLLVREAVSNAARHGLATEVQVVIAAVPDGLRLVISDNGSGPPGSPDPTGGEQGSGIAPMPASLSDRVRDLNGTMSIATAPHGLQLTIDLPLSAPIGCRPDGT